MSLLKKVLFFLMLMGISNVMADVVIPSARRLPLRQPISVQRQHHTDGKARRIARIASRLSMKLRTFHADKRAGHTSLALEDSGLPTMVSGISLKGMKATINDDSSVVLITLPANVDGDLKNEICSLALLTNHSGMYRADFYFADCSNL